jgi:hypothetical protein
MSTAPAQGAKSAPIGGSAAAPAASVGGVGSTAGPARGASRKRGGIMISL